MVRLAAGAATGSVIGSVLLASLPSSFLSICVAMLAIIYVGFRFVSPDRILPMATARRIVLPVTTVAGVLQGAAGISAPVSITFLHALNLGRARFIATISVLFGVMSLVQMPTLLALGVLDGPRLLIGALALLPLFLGMQLGNWLIRHVRPAIFDRLIIVLLVFVSLGLVLDAVQAATASAAG